MIPQTSGSIPPLPQNSQTRRHSLYRAFLAPIHFLRRSPRRALLLFAGALLLTCTLAVASTYIWFTHHLSAARIATDRGHNAVATHHLRRCMSVWPEHREVLLLSSRVVRRSGGWEEAEALLDRYWNRHGDDDALALERLLLRATRGELESAAPLLLARINSGAAESRLAREALVVGLLYRFRWMEAEKNLEVWLAASPDDPLAWLLRGKLLEQRAATNEALLSFRKVVELDPEHDEARLRMTTLLLQLRQGEAALAHIDELKARLPDHPDVQVQWVRALALQGRTEESRAALDECLQRFPEFAPALAERGAIAVQAGDDRAAEDDLARATRLAPGDYTSRQQYALVLARNGKAAEATREQESIKQLEADQKRISQLIGGPLQTRPNDPTVPHEIAMIALRSGQPSEGLRWLQAALQVDPDYAPSHQALTGYYQSMGNPALAARHRALARQPANPKRP